MIQKTIIFHLININTIVLCLLILGLYFYTKEYTSQKFLPIKMGKSKFRNAGKGVFSIKTIQIGELIEVCPYLLEDSDKVQGILQNYYFAAPDYGKNKIIFPLGYCGVYNHSSDANAKYYEGDNHTIKIYAKKKILKGEEITIDYGKEYWSSRNLVPSSN